MTVFDKRLKWRAFKEAVFFTVLSGLSLSFFGLFSKMALQLPSIPLVLFLRFFLPLLAVSLILLAGRRFHKLWPITNGSHQAARAISVLVAQYSLFYYLTQGTLLDASMLLSTSPIFIPIISRLIFKHHFHRITWLTTGISLIGVAFILKPTGSIFNAMSFYGLLAGVASAFSQTFYGVNAEKEGHEQNLFYLFLFTTILSLILLCIFETAAHAHVLLRSLTWKEGLSILALGLATMGNQFFRGLSYRRVKPSRLAPFLYSSVVFAGILDFAVYGNTPSLSSILGVLLILTGSFIQWHFARKEHEFLLKGK